MHKFLFEPPLPVSIGIVGKAQKFPITRIFCVGRNYEAHAVEMGADVDREAPFYFTKTALHAQASPAVTAYPSGTSELHFEMELFVALRKGGHGIEQSDADQHILGFGGALDMTRRDLQAIAKDRRRPWDIAKDFEGGAILSQITTGTLCQDLPDKRITLQANTETRQRAHLKDMIHSVPEIIADLSKYYHLQPGDIILTGTPAGVGAVSRGDQIIGQIDGLDDVVLKLSA